MRSRPPTTPGPEHFAAGASLPAPPNPYAAAAGRGTLAPGAAQPRPWAWSLLTHALVRTGALALLACAAPVAWLHLPGSLETALRWLPSLLPAGQQFEALGVQGTLRHGGHIASLRWSGPGLRLQAQDVQMDWDLATLLQGRVVLSQLRAAQLALDSVPQPPAPDRGAAPPGRGRPCSSRK